MIQVRNLTKEYFSENKTSQIALKDVSFDLPSRGMVFIIGKSGSGKSTLLNILGGLDYQTDGEIIVDGNYFSKFEDKDFDNYRNTYLGFVFQNFHLVENLNVKENINLALELQGKKNKKALKEVLEQVDLVGFEKRYPSELSGGQQQRVAIARAIIKKPRLVLADEPTGNLDSKTSKQILDVLKKLAKNTLVVIVSHNKDDANNYADRIIELSDGEIIRNVERKSNVDFQLIENDVINFPHNVRLTQNELNKINEAVKLGGYKISQKNELFKDSRRFFEKGKFIKLRPGRMKYNKVVKLAKKFAKGTYVNSFITSLIIGCIVILLCICQTFATFTGGGLKEEAIAYNEETAYVLRKGYYDGVIYPSLVQNYHVRIDEEEIQEFYDKGYKGKIYKLYNKTLPFSNKVYTSNADSLVNVNYATTDDLYIKYGRGILDCDIEFLAKKYAENGKLNVLAGSLEEGFKDNGIVITDYFADAIIYHNPQYLLLGKDKAYESIVEQAHINNRFTVKAIISTAYLSRYKNLVDIMMSKNNIDGAVDFASKYEELKKSKEFYLFANELTDYFSIGYYIGDKPVLDAMLEDATNTHCQTYLNNTSYFDENNNELALTTRYSAVAEGHYSTAPDGEMHMGINIYNSLFGTNLESEDSPDFKERTITIKTYDIDDIDKENPIVTKTFKITKVLSIKTKVVMCVSNNDLKDLSKNLIIPYALYFDDVESITSIHNASNQEGNGFFSTNEYFRAIYKIQDIVTIFNDIFIIIFLVLVVVCIILMVSYMKKNIDHKKYEIGILRAIGGKNIHLFWIFFYQILLITILIFFFSIGGMILLDTPINNILVTNLVNYLKIDLIKDVIIVKFELSLMAIVNGLIILLALITSIISLLRLRKIKPINIIKEKEI